jgi:hypothetical protein
MSHTKEPWFIRYCDDENHMCMTVISGIDHGSSNCGKFAEEPDTVAIVFHQLPPVVSCDLDDFGDANARRIVACVNACEGYSTDDLEHFGRFLSSGEADALAEHHALIEQQRDELLTICKNAVGMLENCSVESGVCCCGDDMTRHGSPMACGHSPVDSGAHYAEQLLGELRAAIAKAADYRNPGNTACITTGE